MAQQTEEKTIHLTLAYRIQYEPGGRYYSRDSYPATQATEEEYRKIITGTLQGVPLNEIEGIEHVLETARQNVLFMDLYMNKDGSDRNKPLQKPRTISDIRFSLQESEIRKLKRIKDPLEALNRPEEHMRVYRSDGSWVEFTSGFGTVRWKDSRDNGNYHEMEANDFLSFHFQL